MDLLDVEDVRAWLARYRPADLPAFEAVLRRESDGDGFARGILAWIAIGYAAGIDRARALAEV